MKFKEKMIMLKMKTTQVYIAIKSKKTPWYARVIGGLTVAYALSPIDIIPDFIPILGYLDDLILIPFGVWLTMKCIPKSLWDQFGVEAEKIYEDGKPKRWYYAIPIILIWILLIALTIWLIFK